MGVITLSKRSCLLTALMSPGYKAVMSTVRAALIAVFIWSVVMGFVSATRNRYQAAISMDYSQAVEQGKVALNPAAKIKRLTEYNQKEAFLSIDEEVRLRKAIKKLCPQFLPAFTIAIDTGMRASEQFRLKWTQVDLERGSVALPKTKSGKPHRIKLTPDALAAFKELKERKNDTPLVLPNDEGRPFNPVLVEAGLRGRFTWHDLRHAFASRLVEAGVDLRTVAAMMNHSTIQMVMRYAHLAPDHHQDAIDRLTAATAKVKR
jgi:integrase